VFSQGLERFQQLDIMSCGWLQLPDVPERHKWMEKEERTKAFQELQNKAASNPIKCPYFVVKHFTLFRNREIF
jgi:hypothetical protein